MESTDGRWVGSTTRHDPNGNGEIVIIIIETSSISL